MFRTYLPLSVTVRVAAHTYPRAPPSAHLGSVAATFAKSQRHTSPRTASNILRPPTLTTSFGAHHHGGERFSSSPGPKSTRPLEDPTRGPAPSNISSGSLSPHNLTRRPVCRRAALQSPLPAPPRARRSPREVPIMPRSSYRPSNSLASDATRIRSSAPAAKSHVHPARGLYVRSPCGDAVRHSPGGKRAGRARGTRRRRAPRAAPLRPRSARSREKGAPAQAGLERSPPSCATVHASRALLPNASISPREGVRSPVYPRARALRVPVTNSRAE